MIKALLLMTLLITLPSGMAAVLFQLASLNALSFFQTFTGAMGLFVLMNCAVYSYDSGE